MKTAVVYYSLDGNCALIANEIKALLNVDLIQLYTKDEKKRSFMGRMFWGGGMAVMRKKPALRPYTFDPSAYDLIVLGVPVWAGFPAPPIDTFISSAGISGKKVALYLCHAGGMGKSLAKFMAMLSGNEIIAATDFKDPARSPGDAVKQKISDWVKAFGV